MELECGNSEQWAKINNRLLAGECKVVMEEGSRRFAGGRGGGPGWAAGAWQAPRRRVCR